MNRRLNALRFLALAMAAFWAASQLHAQERDRTRSLLRRRSRWCRSNAPRIRRFRSARA